MSVSSLHVKKGAERANKIQLDTKYSFDGRGTESIWLDYDPKDPHALHILLYTFNTSAGVEAYRVYDGEGNPIAPVHNEFTVGSKQV